MSTVGMERHDNPVFEYQDKDDADGPSFWWNNPYTGRRELIASLRWPEHPENATAAVEHLFESLVLKYEPK